MSGSRTFAAGHSSEMGLYEVPCDCTGDLIAGERFR